MKKNTREIFVSMNHQEYQDYLKFSELIDALINEVGKLKNQTERKIEISGWIDIEDCEGHQDGLSFKINGEQDEVVKQIKETFRSEARIEKFSNNIGQLKKLEREYNKLSREVRVLKELYHSIPKWIKFIFNR